MIISSLLTKSCFLIEQDLAEVTRHIPDSIHLKHGMIPRLFQNLQDCNKSEPSKDATPKYNRPRF